MIGELLGISPRSLPESGLRGTQVSCPPIQGKAPVALIGPYVFGRIGGCELPRVAGLRSRGPDQSPCQNRVSSSSAHKSRSAHKAPFEIGRRGLCGQIPDQLWLPPCGRTTSGDIFMTPKLSRSMESEHTDLTVEDSGTGSGSRSRNVGRPTRRYPCQPATAVRGDGVPSAARST